MWNLILIKFEVILLLVSFFYVLYYIFTAINKTFFHVRKALSKEDISNIKVALNKVDLSAKEDNYRKEHNKKKLTSDEQRELFDILKKIRIKTSKKYFEEAKALIIEWLAIDKFNRDLNLELAMIYEAEWNFLNAEYIYTDILEHTKQDTEIMKKLAKSYYMQWKLQDAFIIYLKVNKKLPWDEDVLDMLSEITYDMKDYRSAIKYINDFLKYKPRNIDKMTMKALSFEEIRDFKEAEEVYRKILELQPYNSFARDKMRDLKNMS